MNHQISWIVILGTTMLFPPSFAFAHTTVDVEQYEIEVGWGTEPPVVGYRNDFVFQLSEPGENPGVKTGVKNAFKNLDAVIKFGGITKNLDINSDPRPGHYFSPIIPTRTGTFTIELEGEINGILIDVTIPVEDVESTSVLDFPPNTGSGNENIGKLKATVSSIQNDISQMKSANGIVNNQTYDEGKAYDFAVFGVWLGASGVILSIVAMVKRR